VSVKDDTETVAVLIDRLNTLGTLKDLPKVITELKSNFEKRKTFLNQQRGAQED